MVAHVASVAFDGISVIPVDVQVHLANGLPAFTIVGLADKAVAESRERVRTAFHAMGLSLPAKRITVNLAPADLAKEGSHYDLPIALGLLAAMGALPQDGVEQVVAMGELGLDGALLPVSGILPAAIDAGARGLGIICPKPCGSEALWAGEVDVTEASSLLDLIQHLKGETILPVPERKVRKIRHQGPDMQDIVGQETARRVLEIAAAGGHNVLMTGPPGSGKSMLAACLPALLPPLDAREMLEVSMIHSIAGQLTDGRLQESRPYRAPHHNCSMPAMVGGGKRARPGEITLAHKGILFLDELPEFPRNVLDSLRQPLEDHRVSVARVQSHVTFPADFQLVAAMNPCRCGYLDDPARACSKAPRCAVDYQSKISGPLLDRIDLHVEVPSLRPEEIRVRGKAESSATIGERVLSARKIQQKRYAQQSFTVNARARGDIVLVHLEPDEEGKALLDKAVAQLGLSMRGYHRVLRVARTIADLVEEEKILPTHIAESLQYRAQPYAK